MNTKRFKQRLQQKERDLLDQSARLGGEARTVGEAEVRDPTDAATASQNASQALQEDAISSRTLVEVQAALQRIADDSFGDCTDCGKEIEAARLAAVPWTSFCLKDQNRHDDVARV
jgi:DnaK suppressor protein